MKFSISLQAALGLFTLTSGAAIVRPENTDDVLPSAVKRETDKTSLPKPGPSHPTSIMDFAPKLEAALFPPDEVDIQTVTNTLMGDELPLLGILGETEESLLATVKQVTGNKGPVALGDLDSPAKLKVEAARAPVDIMVKKLGSRFPSLSKFQEGTEKHAAGQPSGSPEIDTVLDDVQRFMLAQSSWGFMDDLMQVIHPGSSLEAREVGLNRRHPVIAIYAYMASSFILGACIDGDCFSG